MSEVIAPECPMLGKCKTAIMIECKGRAKTINRKIVVDCNYFSNLLSEYCKKIFGKCQKCNYKIYCITKKVYKTGIHSNYKTHRWNYRI